MDNDKLRSDVVNRFKRVDNELSRFNKISKYMMYGCSTLALLHAANIATSELNRVNGLFFVGFSSLAITASIAQKSISMGRKNRELTKVLSASNKQIPTVVSANSDTGQQVGTIMQWVLGLGIMTWLIGKLPTPNFNFLIGAVSCSCMAYEYHLTKKNRRILSAEFPKGVVDEHTR